MHSILKKILGYENVHNLCLKTGLKNIDASQKFRVLKSKGLCAFVSENHTIFAK